MTYSNNEDDTFGMFGNTYDETVDCLDMVDACIDIIKDNKWEKAMEGHLHTVKYELERQLSFFE
tara:strand:+ start:488 stop:679 length:192 start_codon:yes stop_codon:yes gene_type:complete